MDISFIIPNYKSEVFLKNCILSLKKNVTDLTWEVIIVNNDAFDLQKIPDTNLPNLHIINHKFNHGFAKACNLGAQIATGQIYFFLNPDTEFKKFDAKNFSDKFKDENIGVLAPQLIMPDGNIQPWSCGYATNLIDILRNNFGNVKSKRLWNNTLATEVDWVSGCALAIKKKLFEEIKGFDEKFFMYFEDADLCLRVKALNKKIIFSPDMQVLHFGGQSAISSLKQKQQYYTSQDYYFKKHLGLLELFLLKQLRKIALIFEK